jgi:hypothetical protein
MRWIAAFSCRLPLLLNRCRSRFADQTGKGAVPLCRAKASLLLKWRMSAVSPTILAAVSAPTPGSEQGRSELADALADRPFKDLHPSREIEGLGDELAGDLGDKAGRLSEPHPNSLEA